MIPVKLHLKNFMSYRMAEVLDFTGFDLAILSGNNGVGKSSLLEAITWAVWGRSRAASDDELIHQGETAMWVEFLFDYEGNRYRVLRSRETKGRGNTTLEFQVADPSGTRQGSLQGTFAHHWQQLTGPTLKQTQDMISKTLKLDYDLFVNSSYLRQGHADEFTTKVPAERKEILAQILDLSLYDQLEEQAKQKKKEAEFRGKLLTSQIEDLSLRAQSKSAIEKNRATTRKAKDETEGAIKEKETALKKFEADRQTLAAIEKEIVLLRHRFEETSDELRTLQQEVESEKELLRNTDQLLAEKSDIARRYAAYKRMRKEYETLQEKLFTVSGLEQERKVIEHREQELQQTIDRLRHVTVCPTCLRTMTKKEAETIIASLTKQFEADVGPKKKELTAKINETGFEKGRFDQMRETLTREEGLEERMRQLSMAAVTKEKAASQLIKLSAKISGVMQKRKRTEQEGKSVSAKREVFRGKQQEWEALEADLLMKRTELSSLQERMGGLNDRLLQIVSMEREVGAKSTELKEVLESVAIYTELALSFGKKGVQAMIIGQAVPLIAEHANLLLQKITSGRLQIAFVTQREKKSEIEEIIETLDITISDELGSRPYEQYSGGEAFRIDFAIRIALAKLLASRAGAKLQFLAIDEGFGSLDTSGREDIVAAISGIREEFSKIIIVTHIEEFKNLFPTRIEVSKDQNGSHIQVISQ